MTQFGVPIKISHICGWCCGNNTYSPRPITDTSTDPQHMLWSVKTREIK
tara:strand:+ start:304 stop:450 length:147 start_codon:yes stop_codon:yes gene_type:complete